MSEPLITIGITCYREGDWLRECWESVLAQTDDRWTAVLVMDGGADEATRALFDALEHPKLRKTALPENRGPYPARNLAFSLTETPYHFYLDGDDQLMPDTVARVLDTFAAHPQADFVYGDILLFQGWQGVFTFPARLTPALVAAGKYPPGSGAYRVALWKKLGGYASEFSSGAGDLNFYITALEAGAAGVHCGGILYRKRFREAQSVSASYRSRLYEKHEAMVRLHPAFFADPAVRERFLAQGYTRSAMAEARAGHRGEAWRLARRAWRHRFWCGTESFALLTALILPWRAARGLRVPWRWLLKTLRRIRSPHPEVKETARG